MKKLLFTSMLSLSLFAQMSPKEAYDHMVKVLPGEWKLSPASQQKDTTGAHNHPAVKRMLGTDKTAMDYKVIGRGSSLKEELLPGTVRHMVTMYHCDNFKECTELRATHYCAKQNQPSFVLNTKESTPTHLVFDCDEERSDWCDSDDSHVHHIILDLSNNYKHLKASYIVYKNGEKANKHTIYHFDKK